MAANRQDLLKILEDLRYVVRSGGGMGQFGGAGGKSFLDKLVRGITQLITLMFYMLILYYVYVIIFKGYPRILIDLPTLSFAKSQNLRKIMTEKDIIFNHFMTLTKTDWGGVTPFQLLSRMYGKPVVLGVTSNDILKHIEISPSYKHMARMQDKFILSLEHVYSLTETFDVKSTWLQKPYFEQQLINPKIDPKDLPQCEPSSVEGVISTATKTTCPAPVMLIWNKDWEFYYQKTKELLNGKNPTDIEVMQTFYFDNDYYYVYDPVKNVSTRVFHKNRKVNTPYKTDFLRLNSLYKKLSDDIAEICKDINNLPFSYFLTIPVNEAGIIDQFKRYSNDIWTDILYNNREYITSGSLNIPANPVSKPFDEYAFYMLEVIRKATVYTSYPKYMYAPDAPPIIAKTLEEKYMALSAYADKLLQGNIYLQSYLAIYMGTPAAKRYTMFTKIAQSFTQLYKGNKTSDFVNFRTYYGAMFVWFEKHPIFSHIYLNNDVPADTHPDIITIAYRLGKKPNRNSLQYQQLLVDIKAAKTKFKAKLYAKTIEAYEMLMFTKHDGSTLIPKVKGKFEITSTTNIDIKDILSNMKYNCSNLKTIIGSTVVLDLYLNGYKKDMIKMFKEQNMSYKEFFHRLYDVYFTAIFEKQVVEMFKRIFSWSFIKQRHRVFMKLWGGIGALLKLAKTQINQGFKSGLTKQNTHVAPVESGEIKMPPPPPEEPQPKPQPVMQSSDSLAGK